MSSSLTRPVIRSRPNNLSQSLLRLYSGRNVTAAKGEDFETLFNRLDERLSRERLNTTNKNLVYRPKRAKELLSLKNPIIVDGKPLEPRIWAGLPKKGDLSRCIEEVTNRDQFNQLKHFMKEYAQYYPNRLEPHHLVRLIRQATTIGLFAEAITFINSPALSPYISEAYYKEQSRIYSIRLENNLSEESINETGTSRYLNKFLKVFEKADSQTPGFSHALDSSLIKLTGLKSLGKYDREESSSVQEEIKRQEEIVNGILKSANVEEQLSLRKKSQLATFYIDLKRASDIALSNNTKLTELCDAVGNKFHNLTFVESYIDSLKNGMAEENNNNSTTSQQEEQGSSDN